MSTIPRKLIYLTQTTLSMDDASTIIDALKKAYPEINSPPSEDICYATTNRQRAVRCLRRSATWSWWSEAATRPTRCD